VTYVTGLVGSPELTIGAIKQGARDHVYYLHHGPALASTLLPRSLSLLKTPKRGKNLEILASPPYRRGHDTPKILFNRIRVDAVEKGVEELSEQ
jgi:hypothetical protein